MPNLLIINTPCVLQNDLYAVSKNLTAEFKILTLAHFRGLSFSFISVE
jgi:hypothetical protein